MLGFSNNLFYLSLNNLDWWGCACVCNTKHTTYDNLTISESECREAKREETHKQNDNMFIKFSYGACQMLGAYNCKLLKGK